MLAVKEVSADEVQQVAQLLSLIRNQVEHTCTQVGLLHTCACVIVESTALQCLSKCD
jgi:hypothetical protein